MKINISGKVVILKEKDVEIAYKLVNSFLSSIKDSAVSHGKMSMYLTVLTTMYVISSTILKNIDPELAEIISKMEDITNG